MSRIKEEQQVVEQMVRLYCRKKEGHKELCPGCQELLQYATARLERCKHGENKPTCKKCPIPLLSPPDAGAHARSDALGGAENDFVPPRCRHQAYPKRIIAYGLLDYPTQLPIMADYI